MSVIFLYVVLPVRTPILLLREIILQLFGNNFIKELSKLSMCVRKPTIWVSTGSDTKWAVQSQKMVRCWKFWI